MKHFCIACVCFVFLSPVQGQVAVNPFGFPPDQSAVVDISHDIGNPRGVLIPRMNFPDILTIPSPANGLMVYDTLSNRFWYYNGLYWDRLGEGFWKEGGPGIQSSPDVVGIGTESDDNFGLTVNHSLNSGIGAHSGFASPVYTPLIPSAFFGFATNGNHGAQFYADSSGTGLIAGVSGSGFAARFLGGNVYVHKSLGIGNENPSSPLVVNGEIDAIASFRSTANTMIELRKDGYQGGFLQVFANGDNDDFYLGKAIAQGSGDVHLYNQGRSFALRNNGLFSFSQPNAGGDPLLIEMRRNGSQHGFIQIKDDILNGIPNVLTVGKPGVTGDIRFENAGKYIVFEPDGDVGIGTNTGLTFPPVHNKLRIHSDKTTPAVGAHVTYTGSSDVRAIEAISTPAPGYGYGGWFEGGWRGIYGQATGGGAGFTVTGVMGVATGGGHAVGVYGTASGGSTHNWAGYFDGASVYVSHDLRIGSTSGATGYALTVDGKIIGEELKIQDSGAWPDYVFEDAYELMPLDELERSIQTNKHLPGIPSAAEMAERGILVGDMQKRMMEKIEELTLHVIALQKRIAELENQLH